MGLLFGKKRDIRAQLLSKLDGREIRYATERDRENYGETVIGKAGFINLAGGHITISCGNDIVFRADAESVEIHELLSLDGVNLTGFDEVCGKIRHVVAYYLYHRK